MENFFLQAIADDLRTRLTGCSLGRVWQPTNHHVALDFRSPDGRFLFVSVDPSDPGMFLTTSEPVALEAGATSERAFGAFVRKRLRGARLEEIDKTPRDRLVRFRFVAFSAAGDLDRVDLVVSLMGRAANMHVVDETGEALASLRPVADDRPLLAHPDERPLLTEVATADLATLGPTPRDAARSLAGFGPTLEAELAVRAASTDLASALASLARDLAAPVSAGRLYERDGKATIATFALASQVGATETVYPDPHAAAEARGHVRATLHRAESARRAVLGRARAAVRRVERALEALADDLAATEGSDRDRELAESLLAQVSTALMVPGGLELVDYYSEDQRRVVVECDRGDTPQAIAERLFARHRKARRARVAIAERRELLEKQLAALEDLTARAAAVDEQDLPSVDEELDRILGVRRVRRKERQAGASPAVSGARRFVSSDGYEILVGRSSAANDTLTFKVARPSDVWLHAADYPGSHVVVRNPGRDEVPHRTVIEAAQLAAFYSDARNDATVDVRYTPRRFVTKPRGAAPGLVRLSRFKTVAVRPAADLDRAT
jgi:predicted ribosome quality control (RQC) complex YloA/Tae2 family protein